MTSHRKTLPPSLLPAPRGAAAQGLPAPRRVAHDRPWAWFAAGWADLWSTPSISLGYGAALAATGWALALLAQKLHLLPLLLPATAGFFLVAPVLAAGLHAVSQRREAGLRSDWHDVLAGFRRNGGQLALAGGALLLLHLFWVQAAALIFALCFGPGFAPPLEQLPLALLRSEQLLPFLLLGTGTGFFLAVLAFGLGALSIPALVARDISAAEAMLLSWRGVSANRQAMALWAGLIVLFTGLALVPLFLGLVVAMPLVGHAAWHAWRDIYPEI